MSINIYLEKHFDNNSLLRKKLYLHNLCIQRPHKNQEAQKELQEDLHQHFKINETNKQKKTPAIK